MTDQKTGNDANQQEVLMQFSCTQHNKHCQPKFYHLWHLQTSRWEYSHLLKPFVDDFYLFPNKAPGIKHMKTIINIMQYNQWNKLNQGKYCKRKLMQKNNYKQCTLCYYYLWNSQNWYRSISKQLIPHKGAIAEQKMITQILNKDYSIRLTQIK